MCMKLVAGPASQKIGKELAELLSLEQLPALYSVHPDGRLRSRLKKTEADEGLVIVQSTPTENDVIYLLQILDFYRDVKPRILIMPYFGYARQNIEYHDTEYKEGFMEACGARAVASKIIADKVATVEVHSKNVLDYFQNSNVAISIYIGHEIGKYFADKRLKNPVFVAPDKGARGLAEDAAAGAGGSSSSGFMRKVRLSPTEIKVEPDPLKPFDVSGKDVVLIDDMISTGDTMVKTANVLKEIGAGDLYAACVHGIFAGDAEKRLLGAGIEVIVTTDTIENKFSIISAAPVIAKAGII